MVPTPAPERVYVFIDGSNLYKGMQTHIGRGPFPPESIIRLAKGPGRFSAAGKNSVLQLASQANRRRLSRPAAILSGLQKTSYLELKMGRLAQRSVRIYCQTCKASFIDAACKQCGEPMPLVKYSDKGTDVNIATDLLINAFDDQGWTIRMQAPTISYLEGIKVYYKFSYDHNNPKITAVMQSLVEVQPHDRQPAR